MLWCVDELNRGLGEVEPQHASEFVEFCAGTVVLCQISMLQVCMSSTAECNFMGCDLAPTTQLGM